MLNIHHAIERWEKKEKGKSIYMGKGSLENNREGNNPLLECQLSLQEMEKAKVVVGEKRKVAHLGRLRESTTLLQSQSSRTIFALVCYYI